MHTSNPNGEIERLRGLQSAGKRLVFTNGCFDILHVGHIRYLTEARALGDLLIIGLNSDRSVRELKGPSRPFVAETERKEILLALRSVDAVIVFDEPTPFELISAVQPDVLVKGGDWPVNSIVGADVVMARGGQVFSLPFTEGRSTSSLVENIQQQSSER